MTINVRHDAPIEVTIKAGKKVLSKETVEAKLVGAHLDIHSVMYGGVSGYVNWHDDKGNPLSEAPKVSLKLLDESYQLAEGEECKCTECIKEYGD